MTKSSLVIAITGASSGIGRTLADDLYKAGHQVLGLSRGEPSSPYAFRYLQLDVTDEATIIETVAKIKCDYGRLDVLINCAGIGISGAIEQMSFAQAHKIMNVNVIGAFHMCKYSLPLLRESHGIIYNIGSVAGPITIPFQTFYSMSKAALQTFSEGLRLEVKPFNVRVVTILPGDTKSSFTVRREKIAPDELYGARLERSISVMEKDEKNGKDPQTVSRVIRRLLYRKHPPVMVTVGFSYKVLVFLSRILPRQLTQFIIYQIYGK